MKNNIHYIVLGSLFVFLNRARMREINAFEAVFPKNSKMVQSSLQLLADELL